MRDDGQASPSRAYTKFFALIGSSTCVGRGCPGGFTAFGLILEDGKSTPRSKLHSIDACVESGNGVRFFGRAVSLVASLLRKHEDDTAALPMARAGTTRRANADGKASRSRRLAMMLRGWRLWSEA